MRVVCRKCRQTLDRESATRHILRLGNDEFGNDKFMDLWYCPECAKINDELRKQMVLTDEDKRQRADDIKAIRRKYPTRESLPDAFPQPWMNAE